MPSIIAYPALDGMAYPRLESTGLMRILSGPEMIASLPLNERQTVRVLMTSASRGCSVELAAALPNLGFVVSQGAGKEHLDMAGLEARGVKVRCVGEALTDDVADLTMALTHMVCRNLVQADAFVRNGAWQEGRFGVGDSLVGMTMGIAGLSGRIGQAIAIRARASRMTIAGLDRPSNRVAGALLQDARLHDGWLALAKASDVLVLAVPGSPELVGVINAEVLSALGSKGRLINVGRGALVDTDALIEALETGTIAGAALDVLDTEPVVPDRLAALSNVVLTPHIGGQTWGQRARGAKIAEDEVLAFLGLSPG